MLVLHCCVFIKRKKMISKYGLILVGIICLAVVIYWMWRVLIWAWWTTRKLERCLRQQGLKGTPPKFLYGDLKELVRLERQARAKPMSLSHNIVRRVIPFLHQSVERYGPLSFTWLGVTPRVCVLDPELIKDVLCNKFGYFSKLKSANPFTKLLAQGLVSYEGEKWAKHRRIINPAFHLEKLKMMIPAIYASCSELVEGWEKFVTDGSCELDVWPDLQNLTGDVISRTAFGSNYEQGRRIFQLQTEQAGHYIQAGLSVYLPGFRFLPTRRNKRMIEIDREIKGILRDMIQKREKAMRIREASQDDLLGLLLDSNMKEMRGEEDLKSLGMTIDEVIEECKLFYFAGQDTTSVLLVWTMVVLSIHPEWQARAREEILLVFGKSKPDIEGINQLKIVTMIFYEVLRLYSPVPVLRRYTCKEMKLGEVIVPPGVQIALPVLLVHHNREIWGEDVEEFKPERFSGGISKASKNQIAFFPFGWGPRICIGQNFAMIEAKMAMSMILQRFSFKLSPTYVHAPYTVINLKPQYGAQLILHKL